MLLLLMLVSLEELILAQTSEARDGGEDGSAIPRRQTLFLLQSIIYYEYGINLMEMEKMGICYIARMKTSNASNLLPTVQ